MINITVTGSSAGRLIFSIYTWYTYINMYINAYVYISVYMTMPSLKKSKVVLNIQNVFDTN